MKPSVRSFTVVAAAILLLAFASAAPAIPIIYQETGIASGTIGGAPFTNVLVTVTLTGDTSNVGAAAFLCPTCLSNRGTARVNVPGIGTATVTDPTGVFSSVIPILPDTDPGQPVFPILPYVVIAVFDHFPALDSIIGMGLAGSNSLLGYDLRTSIGPITSSPGGVGYDPCCLIHTTLGNLTFTQNLLPTGQGTFAARVPEPSSLLLLGAGAFVLAGFSLRLRQPRVANKQWKGT